MKKVLLVAFAALFAMSGSAWAGDACEGCAPIKVGGYIGPNFRMHDQGAYDDETDYASDVGFGMAFARFNIKGMHSLGDGIIKKIGWTYETDIKQNVTQGLVYAFVDAYFSDQFMLRLGRQKEAFSREWLHASGRLLTVDRHVYAGMLGGLGYTGYSYGLTAFYKHEMFKLMGGVYDGQGARYHVSMQDPKLDFAFRATANPTPCLEIGANVAMRSLPGVADEYGDWEYAADDSEYIDDPDYYQSNSVMAYGADLNFKKEFESDMSLWAQAEFGAGDNYSMRDMPATKDDEETWEDYEWYSFQYFYVKALFMATKMFGFHLGFSSWDPNTDSDVGENNSITKITPGVTVMWSDMVRTQIEVQMITEQEGVDSEGENLDDCEYTHFVFQQVVNW